jgi:ornithine carbamoyltransferase
MKRDLLTLADLKTEEMTALWDRAAALKRDLAKGIDPSVGPLRGKSVGLIFHKPSTRTRISFEVGVYQLGGQAIYLTAADLQLGRGETVADTARVLSRYLQGIVIRTFDQDLVEDLARHAAFPVINGLTDLHHPCQALADLFTIRERKGTLQGIRMAYVGDGNNVAHSLLEGAALTGMRLTLACPHGYEPRPEVFLRARERAKATGARLAVVEDPNKAAQGADILYTDVWTSMGQEAEAEVRLRAFQGYQIDAALLRVAAPGAIVLHCLPAHRGEEIAAEVMDGPQSAVWDQAENRLHVQKAILEWLIA